MFNASAHLNELSLTFLRFLATGRASPQPRIKAWVGILVRVEYLND